MSDVLIGCYQLSFCLLQFKDLPTPLVYSLDCSASGFGNITGDPILLQKVKDKHKLNAKFEVSVSTFHCMLAHTRTCTGT